MLFKILIVICGLIISIGILVSFVAWYSYRHQLLKNLVFFWLSGLGIFILGGFFSELDIPGFLAFSLHWVSILFIMRMVAFIIGEQRVHMRFYHLIMGVGIFVSLGLLASGFDYSWSVLPFSLACAFVLGYGGFLLIKHSRRHTLNISFGVLMILNGAHMLDYPFLRTNPDMAIYGFVLAFIFYFSYAVLTPVFILYQISQEYTARLVAEVKMRTLQLSESNNQLTIAFDNLKESSTHVEALLRENQTRLSALVHDISNPLQMLFMNLNQLIADPQKFLEMLPSKASRLNSAINTTKEILKEARNKHVSAVGESLTVATPVDLDLVLTEVKIIFEERLAAKEIDLVIDMSQCQSTRVLANFEWLKNQVVSNLLSNAIKFSHPGSKIFISCFSKEDSLVALHIKDQGIGIPKDKQGRLFEFDYRNTSLGTQGEVGTGFGLPLVKQYLQLMGGQIKIFETSDQGTTFEVLLRAAFP